MRARITALCFLIIGLFAPSIAHANDPATAQALFDQARKLMTQERWSEACPKLEESQKLDPGGGTLLHLALCREHEGRTATAWAHYQDALSQAKRDGRKDRARIAEQRIAALAPRLPKMRVKIAFANRTLPGFKVTRNETAIGEAQWNEAVPVDPRGYVITAQADGRRPWTAKVNVPAGAGETVVTIPELDIDPRASEAPKENQEQKEQKERPKKEPSGEGDTQRLIGLITGGVGVAGLAVGSVFGLISMQKGNDADAECKNPEKTICTQRGVDLGNEAIVAGNVSTIAFIAGGVFVIGGAVLYFTAPNGTTVGVTGAPNRNGATFGVTGRF